MNRVLTFGGHMRLERIKETCSLFSMQMNFYTIDATLNSIDEIIQHAISRGEYVLFIYFPLSFFTIIFISDSCSNL